MAVIRMFRDLRDITSDGEYTQRELISLINSRVSKLNNVGIDHDELVGYIERSFTSCGIVDTYNDIGYDEFIKLIDVIITNEIEERLSELVI